LIMGASTSESRRRPAHQTLLGGQRTKQVATLRHATDAARLQSEGLRMFPTASVQVLLTDPLCSRSSSSWTDPVACLLTTVLGMLLRFCTSSQGGSARGQGRKSVYRTHTRSQPDDARICVNVFWLSVTSRLCVQMTFSLRETAVRITSWRDHVQQCTVSQGAAWRIGVRGGPRHCGRRQGWLFRRKEG
jgi:hypothetical protein